MDFLLPTGVNSLQLADGTKLVGNASNRALNVSDNYYGEMRKMGCRIIQPVKRKINVNAPIAAELVSIKAAAVAANGAITIAAQPGHPSKLQIRQVIVTAITAGLLTLIGKDPSGNALQEIIDLTAPSTTTKSTTYAWGTLTSGTVSGLVGGGDGTLGLGVGTALGLPVDDGYIAGTFAVYKAKVDAANEAVGTVDAVANTIAPTTAANATRNFEFWYSFDKAA